MGFEPNDSRLRSSECLKNAAGLAVDSTSAVLSQTVFTIIKIEQQYVELIDVLITLLEYQMQMLDHDKEVERIEDIVLETRHELGQVRIRRQDLDLLFSSAEKLADATAEVAFASGAEYASTSTGERLHSAQREVSRVKTLSDEAEKRLVEVEVSVIAAVSKHEDKLKKSGNSNNNNTIEICEDDNQTDKKEDGDKDENKFKV